MIQSIFKYIQCFIDCASLATKKVLGVKYQKLTAFYLISAVCFGPVAVLLIGVEFIKEYFVSLSSIGMGVIVYLLIYLLLIQKIKVIGLIMLVATSLTSIILVYASVNILLTDFLCRRDHALFTLSVLVCA
jgi:APA family basic amino acid/polyamine antiporter